MGAVSGLYGGLTGMMGVSHRFFVVIDNARTDLGYWSKASGLAVTWAAAEHRYGDSNEVLVLPGLPSYGTISLSRAANNDSKEVQKWLAGLARGYKPFSGAIKLVDSLGMTIIEWRLKYLFPIGWKVGELEAKSSTVVQETLDLRHGGFLDDDIRG